MVGTIAHHPVAAPQRRALWAVFGLLLALVLVLATLVAFEAFDEGETARDVATMSGIDVTYGSADAAERWLAGPLAVPSMASSDVGVGSADAAEQWLTQE